MKTLLSAFLLTCIIMIILTPKKVARKLKEIYQQFDAGVNEETIFVKPFVIIEKRYAKYYDNGEIYYMARDKNGKEFGWNGTHEYNVGDTIK